MTQEVAAASVSLARGQIVANAVSRPLSSWVTFVIAGLLVWLPLQTTVALVAYQYGGLDAQAAALILLLKDVVVAAALVVLLVRNYRQLDVRWFDWLAIGFVALVGLYSLIPWILGSELPLKAVAASARIFAMPVELYALGRLAVLSGVDVRLVVKVFLGASAVAAGVTVLLYLLAPASFWITVVDLPRFVREVQGYPAALTLADISVLGHYGVGEQSQFLRATWPFTHPVGTGHYFVLPLVLSIAGAFEASRLGASTRVMALWLGLVLLFVAAVVTPISRGSWIAAAVAALVCGLAFRRPRVTLVGLGATAVFLLAVVPFSYAITSAISGSDSSTIAHGGAIVDGITTVVNNPIGLGMGQADQPGVAFGEGEAAGIGENMYLSILVSTGPLGFAAFVGWVAGAAAALRADFRTRRDWYAVALFACLLGFVVSAITASPLMRFTTSASFWLILGLLVATAPAWRPEIRLRRFAPGLGRADP